MSDYIEGPHIITSRVHTSNGFSYQESMTVGCRVGYDLISTESLKAAQNKE